MGGKRWMRWVIRWGVAAALAAAAFALGWWVCDGLLHRDEAVSLAIAGAAAGIVMVIAGWWAPLGGSGQDSGGDTGTGHVKQTVEAGGDAEVAGRDLGGPGGGSGDTGNVTQRVKSGRNSYVAGRDLRISKPKE
jgi:hypothetical protein